MFDWVMPLPEKREGDAESGAELEEREECESVWLCLETHLRRRHPLLQVDWEACR